MPRIQALLDDGQTVPLIVTGGSMTPFLIHNRDTVFLSPPDRTLKRGDIILYLRDNGQYVLHRIYRAGEDSFTLVGDAQNTLEHGIRPDQVVALVTAVKRKGKVLRSNSFWWLFFEKVWLRIIPVRHLILGIYTALFK